MFCPADIQYKTNQVLTRAPLWVAVGRLRTTPVLHIGASLRRRRARPRPRPRTPIRPRVGGVAGGPVDWTCFSLGGGFKFVIASVSSSWSPLVPSRFFLASLARKFQVRDCLSFRFAWFSRLRPVGPRSGRHVTVRSAGPRLKRPCLACLPSAPGSVRPGRSWC